MPQPIGPQPPPLYDGNARRNARLSRPWRDPGASRRRGGASRPTGTRLPRSARPPSDGRRRPAGPAGGLGRSRPGALAWDSSRCLLQHAEVRDGRTSITLPDMWILHERDQQRSGICTARALSCTDSRAMWRDATSRRLDFELSSAATEGVSATCCLVSRATGIASSSSFCDIAELGAARGRWVVELGRTQRIVSTYCSSSRSCSTPVPAPVLHELDTSITGMCSFRSSGTSLRSTSRSWVAAAPPRDVLDAAGSRTRRQAARAMALDAELRASPDVIGSQQLLAVFDGSFSSPLFPILRSAHASRFALLVPGGATRPARTGARGARLRC